MSPDYTPTSPVGFINKAEAYRMGAQLLARDLKGVGGWAGDPTRYLYYHAMELYMKAALISVGHTDGQLRSIGHSFVDLATACNGAGLGLNEPDDLNVLAMIDRDRNYIRTRYHYVGAFSVATIQALDSTAHELAVLTVQMVRRSKVNVRAPKAALPYEYRFRSS